MTKYIGGSDVKAGFFWNLRKWELTTLSGNGGTLPGSGDDRFVKVPMLAFLFIAPVMGGLYAFFLPFIGFAMALYALGKKVGLVTQAAFKEAVVTVSPAWRPGEAYFAGKPDEKAKPGEGAPSESLQKLEKEIAERREEEKK
jgi:hypothetical protein